MPFPGITITYRTTGVWGAGKGSNLNAVEFDENNYSLALAVQYLADNPPTADNIDHITVTGNSMTITTQLGTVFGPFTLPIAEFRDRGAFADATDYEYGDIFTAGTSLVMVLQDHTSEAPFNPAATGVGALPLYRVLFNGANLSMTFLDDGYPAEGVALHAFDVFAVDDLGVYMVLSDHAALAAFDPAAVDGDANPYYKKIFSAIQTAIARIQFQYPGSFPSDSSLMLKLIQDDSRDLVFALNFPDSLAHLEVAVTAEIVFSIQYAGEEVGTITFSPGDLLDGDGGQFGAFAGDGATIPQGDLLRILAPGTADATARFLTAALVGTYTA